MADIDLEALDDYLMSDTSPANCMALSELDGFLTGIVASPESVPSSEWMPAVWDGDEPEFVSEQQMQTVLDSIMRRYSEIAATMRSDPDGLAPIFDEGPDGKVVAADWAVGFLGAIKLRLQAWDLLLKHRRAKILLVPLIILGDDEDFFEYHPSPHEKVFYASKPDVLKTCAIGIYDFWQDHRPDRRRETTRRQRGGRRRTR